MRFPCSVVLTILLTASITYGQEETHTIDPRPVPFVFFKYSTDSIAVVKLLDEAERAVAASLDSMQVFANNAYKLTTRNVGWNDHPLLISCYSILYELNFNRERFAESATYLDSALAMSIRLYPDGHSRNIEFLYHLSVLAFREQDDATAHDAITAARYLVAQLGLSDSSEYSPIYEQSGWAAIYAGDFETADSCLQHALELERRILPENSVAIADFLSRIAYAYSTMHRAKTSIELFEDALHAFRADSLTTATQLLECLQVTATHFARIGIFSKAEPLFQEAEDLYRAIEKRDDLAFAWFLLELGEFYLEFGKYSDAERVMFEAYDLYIDLGKPDDYLWAPVTIAKYYTTLGFHAEAESYYQDACKFARKAHGTASQEYAVTMKNLGDYHLHRGRYNDAIVVFQDLRVFLESTGPESANARILIALSFGHACEKLGLNELADSLYSSALAEATTTYSEDHPVLALVYNNIGLRYRSLGNHDDAGTFLKRASDIYRKTYLLPHPKLASTINNLAKHYSDAGMPDSAEILFVEALNMRRELFTIPHPDILNSLLHYGKFLAEHHEVERATKLFSEMLEGLYQRMNESFEFESEGNQLEFLSKIVRPSLNALSRFCIEHGGEHPSIAEMLLSATVRLKGAIANESAIRQLEFSKSKQVIKLNNELTTLREQQSALASRTNSPELRAERTSIREKAGLLEAAIRKLDRRYAILAELRTSDWKDLQSVLRPDEAIIEYFAVPQSEDLNDPKQSFHYAAIVLRHTGNPVIAKTCTQDQLKPFLIAGVKLHNRDSYISDGSRGAELSALVWKPVESLLAGIKTLFIVPDGELHRISFVALPSGNPEKPYLDDIFDIRFLSCSKQLLTRSRRFALPEIENANTFLLIGDPDFSASLITRPKVIAARRYQNGWGMLPGTRIELSSIADACIKYDVPHNIIMGKQATEDTLKSYADRPPRALHIATHGFFFAGVELETEDRERLRSVNRGGPQLRIISNPMLRSGLVLTGANAVWTGEVPAISSNDGILTALEVSRLNLVGTELVTLSACETGLGDVMNGEGIFGLQRAFQVAGAEAVIMSLWKVADEPTAALMKNYYEAWLSGATKAEAFRIARAQLRKSYPSPYFWAAFVLVGE